MIAYTLSEVFILKFFYLTVRSAICERAQTLTRATFIKLRSNKRIQEHKLEKNEPT